MMAARESESPRMLKGSIDSVRLTLGGDARYTNVARWVKGKVWIRPTARLATAPGLRSRQP
jgi:hypothetical protein